ncbi:hypothetical protein QF031_000735 [Pseudarthrobacter defluvii]|uniref:hypothetical protein n=1 Tax=Pseudarthrobacter defluvii TaxID=410837 RepID=UPI002782ED93|nr:hypothetical protein [Pseudarthrobacter defluvii]MDQ0767986.1 hypothetical protein [Pseudarthrobacter defluvii]
MALSDYALALTALLGTLLVPFAVLYQMLRLKRRAIRISVRVASAPSPRGK